MQVIIHFYFKCMHMALNNIITSHGLKDFYRCKVPLFSKYLARGKLLKINPWLVDTMTE